MLSTQFSRICLLLVVAALGPAAQAIHAQDSTPSSVTVRTFDCRGADVNDVSSCKPLPGVPIFWFTLTAGYPKMTQTRFTNDDGTDRLELPGLPRVSVSVDGLVSWTSEDLVNLGQAIYIFWPEPGESVTLDFLFVTAEENVDGPATVTVRTFDCSHGDPAVLATCTPIPGAFVSARGLRGGPARSAVHIVDDSGEVAINWIGPDKALIAVPRDQSCSPFGRDNPDAPNLVPLWTHTSFWLMPGDEIVLDAVFVPGVRDEATPEISHLDPVAEQQIFDPCAA